MDIRLELELLLEQEESNLTEIGKARLHQLKEELQLSHHEEEHIS